MSSSLAASQHGLDSHGVLSMDWHVLIGISSGIIALCALILSIWQGKQMWKHNKLSFRPHLTTWTHRNIDKGFYAVELINNGLGPALIDEFIIKLDGKVVSGEGTEPIEKALKILFPNYAYQSHHSYVASGYSMAAKEKCTIVAVQFTKQPWPSPELVEHGLNRTDLDVSYKSYYEEPFHLSTAEEKSNTPLQHVSIGKS